MSGLLDEVQWALQTLRGAAQTALERRRIPLRRVSKRAPFVFPVFVNGQAQWQMGDFSAYVTEGFDLNAVIYSAIMFKAKAIAKARLRAYRGDPENPERLPGTHPLAQLVARPNPSQSWLEFQQQREVYLNVAGNSYTWLDRPSRNALPTALYNLRPDRVVIVPELRGIKGFLYVPEGAAGERVPFLPQDMIHIKFPNPNDPLEGLGYGLSPMAPMSHAGDVDNAITAFLKQFIDRGAMMAGLIKTKQSLDDDGVQRVKTRWREQYGGLDNWGEIGVLDVDSEYQRLGLTFEEMGFSNLDSRNESRMLGPFGVPPILIGTRYGMDRSTFSNAEEARKACWEDTLLPELDLFAADDEYYLRDDSGAFVQYDTSTIPALQQKRSEQIDGAYKLWQMGTPANQATAAVGLQIGDIPGGDVGYLPLNLLPVTTTPESPAATPASDGNNATEDTRDGGANGKQQRTVWSRALDPPKVPRSL